jgi:hypothetical protein
MNRARHHFLSGAAFSENQHGMGAVRGFGDDAVELLHLGSAADEAAVALLGLQFLAQNAVFGLQLEVVGDALQQQLEFVNAEGFGDVFVGAVLHGLHRRLHRAVAGHDDHQGFRTLGLDLAESFQAACAGQAQIEQNGIDGLGLQQAKGVLGGIGDVGVEAEGQATSRQASRMERSSSTMRRLR